MIIRLDTPVGEIVLIPGFFAITQRPCAGAFGTGQGTPRHVTQTGRVFPTFPARFRVTHILNGVLQAQSAQVFPAVIGIMIDITVPLRRRKANGANDTIGIVHAVIQHIVKGIVFNIVSSGPIPAIFIVQEIFRSFADGTA